MANFTNTLLLMLTLIYTTALLSTTTATANDAFPTPPFLFSLSNTSHIAKVLSKLGFRELSYASLNLTMIATPATIFAPSVSSLRKCPSCSVPLLLQEYSIPGLHKFNAIKKLPSGTKRKTFAPNGCLTVTSFKTLAPNIVFVNGAHLMWANVYNDELLIVHSVVGNVAHLPPDSCSVEPWFDTFTASSFLRYMW